MRSARHLDSESMSIRQARHFWAKVDINGVDECWEWQAYRNKKGYGVHALDGRTLLAHRLSHAIAVGAVPEGSLVLHSCDNPPCVNPRHLALGTNRDNMREMVERGRSRSSRPGEANPRSVLTAQRVLEMRQVYALLRRDEKAVYRQEMAARFGVSARAIQAAIGGENWGDEWILRDGADAVKKAMFGA